MIDIESEVFDTVALALRSEYRGIFVTGEPVDVPARFPAVTIIESGNSVITRRSTLRIENAAKLMYEVNIYTNTVGYKKQDAKEILSTVDKVMSGDPDVDFDRGLGFTRTMCYPVQNIEDATIYRIFARYEADVDNNSWIYQS